MVWLFAVSGWLLILFFFRRYRIWPFYYIWGAVGFTFLLILFLRGSVVEYWLEKLTALALHWTMDKLGIATTIFNGAAGMVLLFLPVERSWTVISIDIECSGLLETCVFVGLLLFYPAFSLPRRLFLVVMGMLAIFIINLIRLYVIVFLISFYGRQVIYLAHTVAGRLIFFLLIVALYWSVFSRSTLRVLGRQHNG